MLEIGLIYELHGKFNYGKIFTGKLLEIDRAANMAHFVDCKDLMYGKKDEGWFNLAMVCAMYPQR